MNSTSTRARLALVFGIVAVTVAFLANRTEAQEGNATGTWSGTGIGTGCSNPSPTSPADCSFNQFPVEIALTHIGNTLTATVPADGGSTITVRGFLIGQSDQLLQFSLITTSDRQGRPCSPEQFVGFGSVNLADNTFSIAITGIDDNCRSSMTRIMLQRVG